MSSNMGSTNVIVLIPNEQEEGHRYAMLLVASPALPLSLKCAIELGIFDIIARAGPGAKLSPAEIAAKLPITNNNNPNAATMLDSIFRLLASHSVLCCSVVEDENVSSAGSKFQRLYGLLPVSNYFVTNEDGTSLGPWVLMNQDNVNLAGWSQLKDAILEGGTPFKRAHGLHIYEYQGVDVKYDKLFNTAMHHTTSVFTKEMLQVYKGFDSANIKQLVDVGGGRGLTLHLILHLITKAYTHIKGINFDLPYVVQDAPPYPGVDHVGGDMFVSVPSGDAIFMKGILHCWNDDKCIELLRNCYKAIPKYGKVIVVDPVVPIMPGTSTLDKSIFHYDALMMTQNLGGKERSKDEFLALATSAGFSGVRVQTGPCHLSIMEFGK